MTDLRATIESVLEEVDYPGRDGLLAYASEVRARLVAALPGASVEAYHRHRDFVVNVRFGKAAATMTIPLP